MKKNRIIAAGLAFGLLFSNYQYLPKVYAEPQEGSGDNATIEVQSISPLDISTVTVAVGSAMTDLSLPESVKAVITEEVELAITWTGDVDFNTSGEYVLTAAFTDSAYIYR